jgi:hypothetical protein
MMSSRLAAVVAGAYLPLIQLAHRIGNEVGVHYLATADAGTP